MKIGIPNCVPEYFKDIEEEKQKCQNEEIEDIEECSDYCCDCPEYQKSDEIIFNNGFKQGCGICLYTREKREHYDKVCEFYNQIIEDLEEEE